jgi:hypothetical protein
MLCAALYPNIVQVMTPEQRFAETGVGAVPRAPRPEDLKFKTKADGYVSVMTVLSFQDDKILLEGLCFLACPVYRAIVLTEGEFPDSFQVLFNFWEKHFCDRF